MASIMTNKPDLAENKRQECGVRQLEPEIVHDHQNGDTEAQQGQGRKNFESIIRWLLIQEALLFNDSSKLRVIVGLGLICRFYYCFYRGYGILSGYQFGSLRSP